MTPVILAGAIAKTFVVFVVLLVGFGLLVGLAVGGRRK